MASHVIPIGRRPIMENGNSVLHVARLEQRGVAGEGRSLRRGKVEPILARQSSAAMHHAMDVSRGTVGLHHPAGST